MPIHAIVDTMAMALPLIRNGAASRAQISRQVITPAKPNPKRTDSWKRTMMSLVCVNQNTTDVCANDARK